MTESRKGKRLNKQDFDFIKTLQSHGLSQTEIMKITKRGAGTVSTVVNTETFAHYIKTRRAENAKYKAAQHVDQTPEQQKIALPDKPIESLVDISPTATQADVQHVYAAVSELTETINRLLETQTVTQAVKRGLFQR